MRPHAARWLLALCCATAAASATAQPAALPEANAALLRQINAYRAAGARCGARNFEPAEPLAWSEPLERAAEVQAQHMARIGDVTHTGSDGSNVAQRITAQGYAWGNAGENAAAGHDTATATLAQWIGSPGHCANLMGPQFREVAVARRDNPASAYKSYWVMVLATPLARP